MLQDKTILIIGGYGVFGGRLVALLENEPRLTLIIAGRHLRAHCLQGDAMADGLILAHILFDKTADIYLHAS